MSPKRIALQLAMAGAAVIGLLAGMTQPAMASSGATTTAKITPLAATSSCPTDLGTGAKICGTVEVDIAWSQYTEFIVIGTTFKVYHATETLTGVVSGWSFLQNGSVLSSANPGVMGIYSKAVNGGSTLQIKVLGTTGHYFCNYKSDGGNWGGWTTNC